MDNEEEGSFMNVAGPVLAKAKPVSTNAGPVKDVHEDLEGSRLVDRFRPSQSQKDEHR